MECSMVYPFPGLSFDQYCNWRQSESLPKLNLAADVPIK